jgi:hypothetical protein
MKRAVFIFLMAAVLVLLSYPSTQALAAERFDGPTVISSAKGPYPDTYDQAGSGDGCDGDADDLSGYKSPRDRTEVDTSLSSFGFRAQRTIIWVWWNLMVLIR